MPGAEDLHAFFGRGLEDCEHHVLLAHGVRVFDVELLGEGEQLGGRLLLQFLQRHSAHIEPGRLDGVIALLVLAHDDAVFRGLGSVDIQYV